MIILPPVITIDGPSGVGKGALSIELSKKLKWNILDSGAIYRVLAMEALSRNVAINVNYKKRLTDIASKLNVTFVKQHKKFSVFLKGRSVNDQIYNEDIGNLASKVAVFPEVRKVLLTCQRSFRRFPGLIANGRDMGTVVFPNAILKVFLDASCQVRCERRIRQLKKNGVYITYDRLLKKIQERDNRDCTRDFAPLVPSNGSLMFNSSYLSLSEIVHGVLKCFYNAYFFSNYDVS